MWEETVPERMRFSRGRCAVGFACASGVGHGGAFSWTASISATPRARARARPARAPYAYDPQTTCARITEARCLDQMVALKKDRLNSHHPLLLPLCGLRGRACSLSLSRFKMGLVALALY
jgi:hypothetical protein